MDRILVAGIGRMRYPTYVAYSVLGGALWTVSLSVGGYFLGKIIPNVDRYLLPIILLIVVVSVLPSARHILKERRRRPDAEGRPETERV